MEPHETVPAQLVPYRFAAPSWCRISLSCGAIVLWVAALVFNPAAYAATNRWTPFGPGDGRLLSLVATSRGELYVTSSLTAGSLSFPAGEIWQRPSAGAPWRWRGLGLETPKVTALAVHPKNPNALWAASTGPGGTQSIFRSGDGGASWRKVYTGDFDFQIARLTVATTRTSVVLLAETGGSGAKRLLRSADVGASWVEIQGVRGPVAAPPDEPGTVYALSTLGTVVMKSTDNGRTFRPTTGALPVAAGDEVRTLHATYGQPAALFVSLRVGGLFRSGNGGGSFHLVGFRHDGPSALASEPGNPRKVYAGKARGIYQSDFGGMGGSFRPIAVVSLNQIPEPAALAAAPGGPYFLSGTDLYRVGPDPTPLPVDRKGIEAFGLAELRISPTDPSFIALRRYTGCSPNFGEVLCDFRLLLSTDGGATFNRVGTPLSPRSFAEAADLAFDPADPRRRLIALAGGIILLHEPEETGLGRVVHSGPESTVEIAVDGIFLAGGSNGILISEDGGSTWTTALEQVIPPDLTHPLGGIRRIVDLLTNPYAPDRVIARSLEFLTGLPHDPGRIVLYKSANAGRSWSPLRDGEADVEFVPGEPDRLFLLFASPASTELRRSDDFGATSHPIHTFALSDEARDVAIDPNAAGDLYAATRLGVLRSRDGGATWEATAGGFAPFGSYRRALRRVQVAPDGRLIASPNFGGLFENRLSN